MTHWTTRLLGLAILTATLTGCGGTQSQQASAPPTTQPTPAAKPPAEPEEPAEDPAKIAEMRAKLSPEDRALADAQEWCAISTEERLGSMGVPIKLEIKGKPVFICCGGCKKQALADPDKTLASVEQLKAKKKAEAAKK